jgi:hypothetical protein
MDRQPLTDRLGDRLLAEYGGAAAAYSLRALNGNGDSVVRVRRASDNDEKDFTAEQIELGEMVNWVNSQTVPPLDIGVETSGGRIPVPEGGTSIGIPAAAYSLRNLSTTYTGNVVDVRRSSDNAVASFTASQISNGQMLDFVGGDNTIIQSEDFTSGSWNKSSGRVVITSNSITAPDGELTADLATWSTPNNADSLRQDKSFLAQQYTVSIYLKYNSAQWVQMYFGSTGFTGGHANFDLINGVIGGNSNGSSSIEDVGDGWYRCSVTRTASTSGNTAICATVPVSSGLASRFGAEVAGAYYVWGGQMNEGSIKAYTMTTTGVSGNGFVTKWYDQSGNDNHATQGTAASQPKIVNAGSLVSGGIDFDGVDDVLGTSLVPPNAATLIGVANWDIEDQSTMIIGARDSVNQRSYLAQTSSGQSAIGVSSSALPDVDIVAGDDYLLFGVHSGSTRLLSTNGSVISDSGGSAPNNTIHGYSVGALNTVGTNGSFMDGTLAEIIIYDSDQSANRTAIEANIGETYGITGIPAYDNTVDGFVETWYDQSGNGNDATQSVAGSQPKIVDAGVLVSGGLDFDGVDDLLELSGSGLDIFKDVGYAQVFAVAKSSQTGTGSGRLILATTAGSAAARYVLADSPTDSASYRIAGRRLDSDPFQTVTSNSPHGNLEKILTGFLNYNDSEAYLYQNGTNVATELNFQLAGNSSNTSSSLVEFGSNGFDGTIREIIIYPSDQSANRVAIETNINDHYDIYP